VLHIRTAAAPYNPPSGLLTRSAIATKSSRTEQRPLVVYSPWLPIVWRIVVCFLAFALTTILHAWAGGASARGIAVNCSRALYDKRISQEVEGEALGDEFAGYVSTSFPYRFHKYVNALNIGCQQCGGYRRLHRWLGVRSCRRGMWVDEQTKG